MNEKMKDWKIVQVTEKGQEYIESTTLKDGPRSRTTAVFFRNEHKTSNDKIISLKISHNTKSADGWITEKPDKTITISNEQIDKLIDYIQENYTPLSLGANSYISLSDDSLSRLLQQVATLNLQPEKLVDKLFESGVLTENLSVAITAAERKNTVNEFEEKINLSEPESVWQEWFNKNKWILGSEYIKILTERNIDEHHIADYIMQSFDGFLDLVEIKVPSLKFWTGPDSHQNFTPSSDLVSAISQCLNYLYRIEKQSDSLDFNQRISGVKIVKPKCMLVYGRSNTWNDQQKEAFRILNSAYQQINIITYDQLLARAKHLLGVDESTYSFDDESDIPF